MSEADPTTVLPVAAVASRSRAVGAILVFLSALTWSFGGTIGRFIEAPDSWTVVFWRSFWAALFLVGFMVWRDGWRETLRLMRGMGVPGLAVAFCFAVSATAFVVALGYTTVANILLMQAGTPLIAALIGWLVYRERVDWVTWAAIAAVIAGIVIMVSDTFGGRVSPIGDGLALTIAICFAVATVLTRRYADVRMTPATCLAAVMAAALAATQASTLAATPRDMGFLVAFGALNLGLGLAFFASGARLIPAAFAALLGTFEPILAPIWVWLVHGEVPSLRTILGGSIVFAAVLLHIGLEFRRQIGPEKPGVTGLPNPN